MNIYGCVWRPAVYQSMEAAYLDAHMRGILDSPDTSGSGEPVTRGEFFGMLNRTLYVEYSRGGYSGAWKERLIDHLVKKPVLTQEERIKEFLNASRNAVPEEIAFARTGSLEEHGILEDIPGKADRKRAATRAELAVIISRLMGLTQSGPLPFRDLDCDSWYYDDFAKAAFIGIIVGFEGYARPNEFVTRKEADIMLSRAFLFEESHGLTGGPNGSVCFGDLFDMLNEMVAAYYDLPRTYDNTQAEINGNVFIISPDTVLKNTVINGNLYVTSKACEKNGQADKAEGAVTSYGRAAFINVKIKGALVLPAINGERPYLEDCSAKTIKWARDEDKSKLQLVNRNEGQTLADSGANAKLKHDFSLSWEQPDNMLGITGKSVCIYDEDGERISCYTDAREYENTIGTQRLLECAVRAYPKRLGGVEISYGERKPLIFDFVNITVKEAGKALRPSTLTEIDGGVTLSLAEGTFQEKNWYCVTRRHEDPYDREKIIINKRIYMAEQSGNPCYFEDFFNYLGGGPKTGISIQEIKLTGEAKTGFEITLTPESKETFDVRN